MDLVEFQLNGSSHILIFEKQKFPALAGSGAYTAQVLCDSYITILNWAQPHLSVFTFKIFANNSSEYFKK